MNWLLVLCLFALMVQCIIHGAEWLLLKQRSSLYDHSSTGPLSISVIIASHNDIRALQSNLDAVLSQNYEDFEVVLVLDRCTDGSVRWAKDRQTQNPHLKVIVLDENAFGKKGALNAGIEVAVHDYLVFTDSDCRPASENWLGEFAGSFSAGNDVVLGVSLAMHGEGVMGRIAAFFTRATAKRYIAAASIGLPYMAIGRSFGYAKALYQQVGGFTRHLHIPSGDDDLFFQQVKGRANVGFNLKAATLTEVPCSLPAFVVQRIRQLGAGRAYNRTALAVLAILDITALLSNIALVSAFFCGQWSGLLALIVARLLLIAAGTTTLCRLSIDSSFIEKDFWADLPLSLMNPLLSIAAAFFLKPAWKKTT
ncbi:MAG: glycosyltransferase [Salibacteraceae bacterium]